MRTGKTTRWVVAAAALLALVALWFLVIRADDERAVRGLLVKLEAAVRVDPDESLARRSARLPGELADVCAADVTVTAPELDDAVAGRAELANLAVQAMTIYSSAGVTFDRVKVSFDSAKTSASVDARATLTAVERGGGPAARREEAVHFRVVKRDGSWRIASIGATDPARE